VLSAFAPPLCEITSRRRLARHEQDGDVHAAGTPVTRASAAGAAGVPVGRPLDAHPRPREPDTAPGRAGPPPHRPRRVAIVHDFLYCYAGAERVLEQMLALYPDADLFSLFDFLPASQRHFIGDKRVRCSFIHRLPMARRFHRHYLPLMPLAIEQLNVSAYDLVLSSSYIAAKGVITRADQVHVCYCHSPARFAWDLHHQFLDQSGFRRGVRMAVTKALMHYIRMWDVRTSHGVDAFVANSRFVARRIAKTYRRRAEVVYPPVDVDAFPFRSEKGASYVTASRLVPYKRIDLLVDAFARMPDRELIVIGEGPEMAGLRRRAPANVRLLGFQPQPAMARLMAEARAFLFAAEEDFGIVPVEAQACGTPVVALGRGGATETVVGGQTGLFFATQTPDAVVDAIHRFERHGAWDHEAIRANARRFSADRFRREFGGVVEAEWTRVHAGAHATHGPDDTDERPASHGAWVDPRLRGRRPGAPAPLVPDPTDATVDG